MFLIFPYTHVSYFIQHIAQGITDWIYQGHVTEKQQANV